MLLALVSCVARAGDTVAPAAHFRGSFDFGQEPEVPGDLVVVAAVVGGRIGALEEVASIAHVDFELLVVARADHLAVADVVRPGRAVERDVARARERKRAARLPGEPRSV